MDETQDRSIHEFLAEADDTLDDMADGLGELGAGGDPDPETVNRIFRAAHSLKGISGMCGFSQITEVAHKAETLLDAIRMGRVACDRGVLDLLFEAVDRLKDLCARLARGEAPEDPAVPAFLERLLEAANGPGDTGTDDRLNGLGLPEEALQVLTEYEVHRIEETLKNPSRTLARVRVAFPLESFDTDLEALNGTLKEFGEIISTLPAPGEMEGDRLDFDLLVGLKVPAEQAAGAIRPHGAGLEVLGGEAQAPAETTVAPPQAPKPAGGTPPAVEPAGVGGELRSLTQTIRVDLPKLDILMNLVGELVLARSRIQLVSDRLRASMGLTGEALELAKAQKDLERKLSDLQQAVMDVRMVPLGQLFSKLQRVVRKILRGSDKEVDLEIQGADTELDKLIVEDLSDPLIHVIRNAVDHGIEEPKVRKAAGKPPRGTVHISARQRGNHVLIEVSDDGAGIPRARVLEKAVERGLVEPGVQLDDREVFDLLFIPGFSTNDEATEISGRGVGMDVLRRNVARLSGMIELDSTEGSGTRVRILLPITLAIIQALLVKAGEMTFAIPLNNVLETLSLEAGQIKGIEGRSVLRLREATLPLVRLDRLFGTSDRVPAPGEYAVVVGIAEKRVAFGVDDLVSQQDVVIKSLGRRLRHVPGLAGATDLGDQRPIPVMDVAALVEEVFGA